MRKREVLADGQVEIEWDVTRERVEVRVVVSRASAPWTSRLPWLRHDPIFEHAWSSLRDNIVQLIQAQLLVLPHHIGEPFDTDPDAGHTQMIRNRENLLELLEGASGAQCGRLLRSPDVVDGIVDVMAGRKHAQLARLRTILRRCTTARRGAPVTAAGESRNLATAIAVADWYAAIKEPFEAAQALRRERARSIPTRLMEQFNADPNEATILATSRARREARIDSSLNTRGGASRP